MSRGQRGESVAELRRSSGHSFFVQIVHGGAFGRKSPNRWWPWSWRLYALLRRPYPENGLTSPAILPHFALEHRDSDSRNCCAGAFFYYFPIAGGGTAPPLRPSMNSSNLPYRQSARLLFGPPSPDASAIAAADGWRNPVSDEQARLRTQFLVREPPHRAPEPRAIGNRKAPAWPLQPHWAGPGAKRRAQKRFLTATAVAQERPLPTRSRLNRGRAWPATLPAVGLACAVDLADMRLASDLMFDYCANVNGIVGGCAPFACLSMTSTRMIAAPARRWFNPRRRQRFRMSSRPNRNIPEICRSSRVGTQFAEGMPRP